MADLTCQYCKAPVEFGRTRCNTETCYLREIAGLRAKVAGLRGEHLRALRLRAGLSLRPAAELLGLLPKRLSDLEHGRALATDEEWAILFGRLGDAWNTGAA